MMSTRLILAADLTSTIARAGIDPALEGRELRDALLSAIADRQGYLVWLMAPEIGIGQFLV